MGLVSKARSDCVRAGELLEGNKKASIKELQAVKKSEEAPPAKTTLAVSVESLAKLQMRLAPMLACVGSLRAFVDADGGAVGGEFRRVSELLLEVESLSEAALARLQAQVPAEKKN